MAIPSYCQYGRKDIKLFPIYWASVVGYNKRQLYCIDAEIVLSSRSRLNKPNHHRWRGTGGLWGKRENKFKTPEILAEDNLF